jgi:hypothetical protein
LIGSREQSKAERIAGELNERYGKEVFRGFDNRTAAAEAEVVVSTLPHQGHRDILENIRPELEGKLLMVATVIWPPGTMDRQSAAEEAQTAVGDQVRVVAAFQTVSALALQAIDEEMEEDVLVCGEGEAAEEALQCMSKGGLRGIKVGPLKHARIVEAITALMLKINNGYGVKSAGIRITGLD